MTKQELMGKSKEIQRLRKCGCEDDAIELAIDVVIEQHLEAFRELAHC